METKHEHTRAYNEQIRLGTNGRMIQLNVVLNDDCNVWSGIAALTNDMDDVGIDEGQALLRRPMVWMNDDCNVWSGIAALTNDMDDVGIDDGRALLR